MGTITSWDAAPTHAEKLEEGKAAALVALNSGYDAAAKPLLREYPAIERLSWSQQQAEATAYQTWLDNGSDGEPPATPALSAILKGRNGADGTETLGDLVAAVLRNAEAFIQWQEYTGLRQRGEWMIQGAATVEEAKAVTWEGLTSG
ncbi:hypothetical protein [Salinicola lusitanus]|uniref:hypothetical protein n=1 Tax=Salinicola lusitanus TaxID=1949085 RepID=UPI000DA1976A|nr:hypothetical protein [Salinicola lusitanus]